MTTSSYKYPPPKVGMKFGYKEVCQPLWEIIWVNDITNVVTIKGIDSRKRPTNYSKEDYYRWRTSYRFYDPKEPFTDEEYSEIFV